MLNQSLTIRVFLPLSPQTTGLGHVSRRSTTRCARVSSVESSAPKPSAALPLVERGATPVSSALPSHTLADGVSSPTSALEPAKVRLAHINDLEDLFNFFLTVMREDTHDYHNKHCSPSAIRCNPLSRHPGVSVNNAEE